MGEGKENIFRSFGELKDHWDKREKSSQEKSVEQEAISQVEFVPVETVLPLHLEQGWENWLELTRQQVFAKPAAGRGILRHGRGTTKASVEFLPDGTTAKIERSEWEQRIYESWEHGKMEVLHQDPKDFSGYVSDTVKQYNRIKNSVPSNLKQYVPNLAEHSPSLRTVVFRMQYTNPDKMPESAQDILTSYRPSQMTANDPDPVLTPFRPYLNQIAEGKGSAVEEEKILNEIRRAGNSFALQDLPEIFNNHAVLEIDDWQQATKVFLQKHGLSNIDAPCGNALFGLRFMAFDAGVNKRLSVPQNFVKRIGDRFKQEDIDYLISEKVFSRGLNDAYSIRFSEGKKGKFDYKLPQILMDDNIDVRSGEEFFPLMYLSLCSSIAEKAYERNEGNQQNHDIKIHAEPNSEGMVIKYTSTVNSEPFMKILERNLNRYAGVVKQWRLRASADGSMRTIIIEPAQK